MFAALVAVIVGIVTEKSFAEIALAVIVAIIAFYFVGIAVQHYLNKTVFIKEEFFDTAEGAAADILKNPAGEPDDEFDDDDNL